jgi:O-antigen/teichoic acid export membrane protein
VRVKYKLIKNTVANYAVGLWSFVSSFIILYLVIRGFGPAKPIGVEDYGIYLLVGAIVGYMGLLDLGMGHSLVKYIAEYHAKNEKDKVNEVVNSAFFIFLGMGLVGCVGIFLVATFLFDLFNFSAGDQLLKAKAIAYIIGIGFLTSFSLATFKNVLRGLQKYVLLAFITFVMSLLNFAVIIWVLVMEFGIVGFLFYTISFNLIGSIIVAVIVKRELPYLDIKRKYLNRDMVKSLFSLSMLLFLLSFFNVIVFYTDNVVIGWWFVGANMVTFYVAARKIYTIPGNTINIALRAMIPAASELDALQKKKALQILLIKVSKYCLALIFLIGLPSLFMSRYILSFWLGSEFAVYYMVTNILIISLFFDYFNFVSSQILIGMNKIKFLTAGYGIVALLNLVLSVILVQHYGLEGVALGTAIPFIIMAVPLMWSAFRIIGIDWRDYSKEVLGKTVPFALCMAAVLLLLLLLHAPNNLIEVGIYYAISMGVFFALFYRLAMDKEERNDIKTIFSTLRYSDKKEES